MNLARKSPPPNPRGSPEPPGDTRQTLSKTVMFDGKEDLLAKVLAIKERTNTSISGAILSLVEAGLKAGETGPPAADQVAISALPAWMRSALYEAGRLTGHNPAGTVVDVLAKSLREYLADARTTEVEMAKLLKSGPDSTPPSAPK